MSSLGGFAISGKRSFRIATDCIVSSTERVVCVSQTSFFPGVGWIVRASSRPSTTRTFPGASPAVPSTSSWPMWPMRRISVSSLAKRLTSLCTLVTRGHVASMVFKFRAAASACTAGETPWAEKTTVAPSGTSSVSFTKMTPRCSRVETTCLLWTISLRT